MAFIYLGFYLSSKYCPVWVYILIMAGWLYVHFHRDPLCGQCNSLKMFVQELCDVFSSLTASTPGLIYGQRVFSGVDGHFQTGPLGFQLSRPQSESALYRTHAWGHSLPHAPQPRFCSSCYYGQSNPIPLHTHTHSARCTSAFGYCILDRTQTVGLLLMLPALLWFTQAGWVPGVTFLSNNYCNNTSLAVPEFWLSA